MKDETPPANVKRYTACYQSDYTIRQINLKVHTGLVLTDLGEKLLILAEQAYSQRQLQILENVSEALIELPLPRQYRAAGSYFRALELIRQGNLQRAQTILEQVVGQPSHRYSARAMQSLGVTFHARGEVGTAFKLYLDAGYRAIGKGRFDILTALYAQRNIAVLKSSDGDHHGALGDLELMLPIASRAGSVHPQVYYDYLNSIAVELGSIGRLTEARRASEIALASPFAAAYPEWRETFEEIAANQRRASRSVVAISPRSAETDRARPYGGKTHKVMHFPAPKCEHAAELDQHSGGTPARVLNFQEWKSVLRGSSNPLPSRLAAKRPDAMTSGEKLIRLMDLISQDETDDEMIDRILEAVEQIVMNREMKI